MYSQVPHASLLLARSAGRCLGLEKSQFVIILLPATVTPILLVKFEILHKIQNTV